MQTRYFNSIKNSLNFTNRSSREDIVYYTIIHIAIIILLELCSSLFDLEVKLGFPNVVGYVKIIYLFLITFTTLSLVVRRLHDMNKTGFYSLLLLIPLLNILLYIYLLFAHTKDNHKGVNKYGKRADKLKYNI